MKKVLIVGGTSGLGQELARIYINNGWRVWVAGGHLPRDKEIGKKSEYLSVELGDSIDIAKRINWLLSQIATPVNGLDHFIYTAGYYQHGYIDDLGAQEITRMVNVGIVAPTMFLNCILRAQKQLKGGFIAVTSMSQWTPRLHEPVYTAAKAGLAMLASSVSLDERIKKTLVAAPAGMNTAFWKGTDKDTNGMLEPDNVAEIITALFEDSFRYKFARILRNPMRVEIPEVR